MKPYVICHMMSPLDGRLIVDEWSSDQDGTLDRRVAEYDRIHDALDATAWLCGRATMEEFSGGEPHSPSPVGEVDRDAYFADRGAKGFAIALDRKARLHWKSAEANGNHVVVLLGYDVPDIHLAELKADGISYIVAPGESFDLAAMLDRLGRELKIERLLLEGGGVANGQFLKAGLVDEISLQIFPAIDGRSRSPSIFDAGDEGLGPDFKLSLISCEPGGEGSVHLRYKVENR
ncbi:MAG: bifunctional deaminase-reductase domain protein [Rhizobacter sp.]|nr:bifunctional deaminase-reductase domain protein [Rhizobacter sp.]